MFVSLLVANKAHIGSLSSNEIVVYDTNIEGSDKKIEAGITAGYKVDGSPIINDNKKGVRIWAGELTNGDLTTASFTVDSTGKLKASNAEITGTVNATSLDVAKSSSEKSPVVNGSHGYVYFGWETEFVDSNNKT